MCEVEDLAGRGFVVERCWWNGLKNGAEIREQNCIFVQPAHRLDVDSSCFDGLFSSEVVETRGDPHFAHRLAFLELSENYCCHGQRTEGFTVDGRFHYLPPNVWAEMDCWPAESSYSAQRCCLNQYLGRINHTQRVDRPSEALRPLTFNDGRTEYSADPVSRRCFEPLAAFARRQPKYSAESMWRHGDLAVAIVFADHCCGLGTLGDAKPLIPIAPETDARIAAPCWADGRTFAFCCKDYVVLQEKAERENYYGDEGGEPM